jgi:hypothetical protein
MSCVIHDNCRCSNARSEHVFSNHMHGVGVLMHATKVLWHKLFAYLGDPP